MANANPLFNPKPQGQPDSISTIVGPSAGSTPQDYNELFAALLELQWKGIGFPYVKLRTEFRQDLAIHKFADRDGAHIEGMGSAPLEITARVPLINGIDAGKNEHWGRQPLYPFVRDNLLRACADKSSGPLQHPEFGILNCKVQTMAWELDAQVRQGVWVDFKWLQTDDTADDDLQQALTQPSPLANAAAAAADLDSNLANVSPIVVPTPYVPPISFSDLANSLRAVVDQTTQLAKSTAGRADNMIYEANAMRDSLNRLASALNWPMLNSCERAKESCYDLKSSILKKGRPIGFYTTQKDSTLAQIASAIGANVMDVISLNPAYAMQPLVSKLSVVRYYTQPA
jgi:hypothetical protein